MDTDTLVEPLLDSGRRLLASLAESGFEVTAACWVNSVDSDRWMLYIATPVIDQSGPAAAYGKMLDVLRPLGELELTGSDISLIGEKHPITSDLLSLLRKHNGTNPTRAKRSSFGGELVKEVYVYPSAKRHTELNDEQKQLLSNLYDRNPLTVDDLPYTEELEHIHREFIQQTGLQISIRDVFKALMNLRRNNRLNRKQRSQTLPDSGTSPAATDNPQSDPVGA